MFTICYGRFENISGGVVADAVSFLNPMVCKEEDHYIQAYHSRQMKRFLESALEPIITKINTCCKVNLAPFKSPYAHLKSYPDRPTVRKDDKRAIYQLDGHCSFAIEVDITS